MSKEDKKAKSPAVSAWEMFEKTGDISYYLLYKRINGEK
ncbi:MAG: YqzL family protein [Clostridia bacterium]|nr:YqzL family protein [Clostridia bacterium]